MGRSTVVAIGNESGDVCSEPIFQVFPSLCFPCWAQGTLFNSIDSVIQLRGFEQVNNVRM